MKLPKNNGVYRDAAGFYGVFKNGRDRGFIGDEGHWWVQGHTLNPPIQYSKLVLPEEYLM